MNEFTTIKVSKEALQSLIDELEGLVEAIDTKPEPGHIKWDEDDNFGEWLENHDCRLERNQVARLVNIGLVL